MVDGSASLDPSYFITEFLSINYACGEVFSRLYVGAIHELPLQEMKFLNINTLDPKGRKHIARGEAPG